MQFFCAELDWPFVQGDATRGIPSSARYFTTAAGVCAPTRNSCNIETACRKKADVNTSQMQHWCYTNGQDRWIMLSFFKLQFGPVVKSHSLGSRTMQYNLQISPSSSQSICLTKWNPILSYILCSRKSG